MLRTSLLPASLQHEGALDDHTLLAKIVQRDLDAFATFYDAYHRSAYGLALQHGCDHAQAEQVVSNAFLTIWRHSDRFDPDAFTPKGWLLGIIVFHCRHRDSTR